MTSGVTARRSTRAAMVVSAAELLRERGTAAVTIDAVLARSGAPRGSVYHHFPGGRGQILREALQFAGDEIAAEIDAAAGDSGTALLGQFAQMWREALIASDYSAGCPVLAAAIGSGQDEQQLASLASEIFTRWRTASAQAYVREGFETAEASALADTAIAAMEGAVVLCRSTRSVQPLDDVAKQLEFLIQARQFVARFGVPAASS
jgi:TetR/AcrR family transcriptional repressor of lmrAB and yxaGH operons